MLSPKKVAILVLAGVTVLVTSLLSSSLFETNMAGYMQVKQAAVTGDLSCRIEPGTYGQWFGDIHTYKEASTFYFGLDDPADDGLVTKPLTTTFADGAKSTVAGSVRVLLPRDCESLKLIHRKFKSMDGVMSRLVLPALRKVAFQTGPHMTSAESYSERRGEFANLLEDQLLNGIVKVDNVETTATDPITGKEQTVLKLRKRTCDTPNGKTCVGNYERDPGVFSEFHIDLTNFEVADIEYTKTVLDQIEAQRTARMDIITQEAEAQKAEARAKKAASEAEAAIAETRAKEEVQKTQRIVQAEADKAEATLQAEKVRDVARLEKEAAEFEKKRQILLGEGEATRKRLVMQADGALEKKLQALIEINAKYADALSKAQPGALVPYMQLGSSGEGGGNARDLIQLLTAQTAKQLSADTTVKK